MLFFQDIVRKIEKMDTDKHDKPTRNITITDSGSLTVVKPFVKVPSVEGPQK